MTVCAATINIGGERALFAKGKLSKIGVMASTG